MTPAPLRPRADVEADLAAVLAYAGELYRHVATELDELHPPDHYATTWAGVAGAVLVEAALEADLVDALAELGPDTDR